jgi:hypothetical protein
MPIVSRLLCFSPKKDVKDKLNELFGEDELGDDRIKYHWIRNYDSMGEWVDVWELSVWGRELCGDFLFGLHGHKDYELCPCLKEFKKYCQKVNSVLKEHSYTH